MMRPGLQVCRQGHVLALRSDAAARLPKTPALFDVARWLGAHGHVLATRPGALLQLAYEAPPTSLVYSMAERSDVAPEVLHLPSSKDAWPMEMAILSKHAGCVNVAAFSPSGDLIASAGVDASVRLWNPHTGEQRAVLLGHTPRSEVSLVAFSPCGQVLASSGSDAAILLWSTTTGELMAAITGLRAPAIDIRFSPKGDLLAVMTDNSAVVQVWDMATYQPRGELKGHNFSLTCMCFSPTGNMLATASADYTVRVWDLTDSSALAGGSGGGGAASSSNGNAPSQNHISDSVAVLRGHTDAVSGLVFSPDGSLLVSASLDSTLRLWDPVTAPRMSLREPTTSEERAYQQYKVDPSAVGAVSAAMLNTLWGHATSVHALAMTRDGRYLASASSDSVVIIWDASSGAQLATLHVPSPLHTAAVHVAHLSWRPDGRGLAVSFGDEFVRLWERNPATAAARKATSIADGEEWECGAILQAHTAKVTSLTYSPDGHFLSSSSADGSVRLWDPEARTRPGALEEQHSGDVTHIAFDTKGETFATASKDCDVRLWGVENGELRLVIKGHTERVNQVSFSADSSVLATGAEDLTIGIWAMPTGKRYATLKGHSRGVCQVAFTPSLSQTGVQLVSVSRDGVMGLWESVAGNKPPVLHKVSLQCPVAWSPNGMLLAHIAHDAPGSIILRRVGGTGVGAPGAGAGGDEGHAVGEVAIVLQLQGHAHRVNSFCWSPRGDQLAACSGRVAFLWQVRDGKLASVLEGHRSEVQNVAFSSTGRFLATYSQDHNIMIWNLGFSRLNSIRTIPNAQLVRLASHPAPSFAIVRYHPHSMQIIVADDGVPKLMSSTVDDKPVMATTCAMTRPLLGASRSGVAMPRSSMKPPAAASGAAAAAAAEPASSSQPPSTSLTPEASGALASVPSASQTAGSSTNASAQLPGAAAAAVVAAGPASAYDEIQAEVWAHTAFARPTMLAALGHRLVLTHRRHVHVYRSALQLAPEPQHSAPL